MWSSRTTATERGAPARARWGAVLVLLAGVSALALWNLARLPIWYDETITLLVLAGDPTPAWPTGIETAGALRAFLARDIGWGDIVPLLRETDVHPPLYYVAALAWSHVTGGGLVPLRLLSALCILSAGGLVALALRRSGAAAATLAAMVFLLAPMAQWAAINARGYAPAILLVTLVLVLILEEVDAARRDRVSRLRVGTTAVAAALAFWTHYFAILITGPALAVLALFLVRRRPATAAAAILVFGVLVAALSPLALHHTGARASAFAGFQGPAYEAVAVVWLLLTALVERPPDGLVQRILFPIVAAALVLLPAAALARAHWRHAAVALVVSLGGFSALLLVLFAVTDKTLAGSFGAHRYVSFTLPAIALLVGLGFAALRQPAPKVAWCLLAVMAISAASVWADGAIRFMPWGNRIVMQPAMAALSDVPADEALVVLPRGWGGGTPGTWAHELDPATPVLVVRTEADFAAARRHLDRLRVVVVAGDESHRLDPAIEAFRTVLEDAGFAGDGGLVFRAL